MTGLPAREISFDTREERVVRVDVEMGKEVVSVGRWKGGGDLV
jgi:hypothetical protein